MMRRAAALLVVLGACRSAPVPRASVTLVESVPLETRLDHPDVPDAPDVWLAMIDGARRSLDFAEFYASDADAEEKTVALLPQSKLGPVLEAVARAVKRGVRVRFLADAKFAKTYPTTLARLAASGVDVRRYDVARTSGGVLHAKYFVVDGEDCFIGSQNFDWRALSHIFEMGVRVRSARFAGALLDVFETDWAIAGGAAPTTRVRAHPLALGVPATTGERLSLYASPRGWLPREEDWDLPVLVAAIDAARRGVDVGILTYKTTGRRGERFTEIDDALRHAASRGVHVRLLVSEWATRPNSDALRAVQALATVPNIEVRVLRIPAWSGGEIPFARVAHAKYMIVDGATAWVGTSNFEADYFLSSRNVSAVAEGGQLPAALQAVFDTNWAGPHAGPLE